MRNTGPLRCVASLRIGIDRGPFIGFREVPRIIAYASPGIQIDAKKKDDRGSMTPMSDESAEAAWSPPLTGCEAFHVYRLRVVLANHQFFLI